MQISSFSQQHSPHTTLRGSTARSVVSNPKICPAWPKKLLHSDITDAPARGLGYYCPTNFPNAFLHFQMFNKRNTRGGITIYKTSI